MVRFLTGVMVVALLLGMVGCSDNPADSMRSNDLASQFGGFTAGPESPAFGDPVLAMSSADEHEYNDPIAASPMYESLSADPDAGFYHLRVVWGRLQLDSAVTTPTDWSGSLTISRGGLLLRRVIRFEPATDSIYLRTDVNKIEWASVTTVHNDGIAVDLVVPPAEPIIDTTIQMVVDTLGDTTYVTTIDTTNPAPVTVEFSTAPYSRTFTLAELAKLDTVVYLEDSNAVAFDAFRMDHFPCPHGFLSGSWGYDSTGQGVFLGKWIGRNGMVDGHVRGTFGEDSTGRNMFFGKWIDASGNFEGLLRGRWGLHPDFHADSTAMMNAGGWFRGAIFDDKAHQVGLIGGHFMTADNAHKGFMQGRWKVGCLQPAGDMDDGMGRGDMGGMDGGGMGDGGDRDGMGGMHFGGR